MIYTYNNSNEIYFSHIPRTGGRYLHKLLFLNGYEVKNKEKANLFFYNEEYMHLTLNTAYKVYEKNLPENKLSVIRHPVSRFISALSIIIKFGQYEQFFGTNDIEKGLENYNTFIRGMEYVEYKVKGIDSNKNSKTNFKGLKNYPNNWFKSQMLFIDDSFHLWKFENGLGENFFEFMSCHMKVDIKSNIEKELAYRKRPYDIVDLNLSEKSLINIKRYYNEDYNLWKTLK